MEINITKKDVLWGYLAQFFNIGAGILLLPVILKLLPADILGVWYIFLTISSLVQMIDFGFQPTFTRNVAYVFSGAVRLQAEGLDKDQNHWDHPNYPLLKNMIAVMKRFYGSVSLLVIFLLLTAGSWYINDRTDHIAANKEIMISWFIYTTSTVLNLYYSYYNALLVGRGLVKENNQLIILTRSTYLVLAALGLIAGYGLIAVASANLLSIIVNRLVAIHFFYQNGLRKILRETQASQERLLPVLWVNAKKNGLSNLGGYFVQKGNLLFISMFLSLETVASYGLTVNLINILAGVSPLYLNTHIPQIYKDRIDNNLADIRKIFGESIFIFYFLYALGALCLVLLGPWALELFHSKTQLLPLFPLLLMLIVQFLESNHGMAATLITTRNEVPYLNAALVSGFFIALFSLLSLYYTDWGICGVVALTGLVQISYNNWKWPLMVSQELEKNYLQLMKIGIISLKDWGIRHLRLNLPFIK